MQALTDGAGLDMILADAQDRLSAIAEYPVPPADLEWRAWPQVWSDTTLGRGGIGGQALTAAQTVMIEDAGSGAIAVYHGWRFDYLVLRPADSFRDAVAKQRLPAQKRADFERET